MSNSNDENEGAGIPDEELPDDLRPGEDNPLAEGLDDAETAGDLAPGELLDEGKRADQQDDAQDGDRDRQDDDRDRQDDERDGAGED